MAQQVNFNSLRTSEQQTMNNIITVCTIGLGRNTHYDDEEFKLDV